MLKRKSFTVIGLGSFGSNVAIELCRTGAYVLALDQDDDKIEDIKEDVTCARKVDVLDTNALANQGLSNMDCVIIATGSSLEASVMSAIIAKEENVPYIVAKASNVIHGKVLLKLGVDRVIIPEKDTAMRLAKTLTSDNFKEFVELSSKISMIEIAVKEEWVGKNLKQLDLRQKYAINVIAIRKNGEIISNVNPDEPLSDDITLLVIGDIGKLDRLA